MKVYLGILGDPAKLSKYDDKFYSLLQYDTTGSIFYLLGASEKDVTKEDYQKMYDKLINALNIINPHPIDIFTNDKSVNSRIGLFPSSHRHLLKGPSFVFAPFPANSTSKLLKLKSKLIINLMKPFVKLKLVTIAYFPQGGKAAYRTKADLNLTEYQLIELFKKYKSKSWFQWYYLEAGSGEKFLDLKTIQSVLKTQIKEDNKYQDIPLIVPKSIYGGGIIDIKVLNSILTVEKDKLIPNCIIIGNISEENIDITIEMVKRINEFNSNLNS